MVFESIRAAQELEKAGIDVELIDLRSAKPLDEALILESVKKTGRLVVADGGWKTCGISAELSALVTENGFNYLEAPVKRVTLPDVPAPASCVLEKTYYPNSENIIRAVKQVIGN